MLKVCLAVYGYIHVERVLRVHSRGLIRRDEQGLEGVPTPACYKASLAGANGVGCLITRTFYVSFGRFNAASRHDSLVFGTA